MMTQRTLTKTCSLSLAWLGFKDWFRERVSPSSSRVRGTSTTKPPKTFSQLVFYPLIVLLILAGLVVLTGDVGPIVASGLGSFGAAAILYGALGVSLLSAAFILVGYPAYLIYKGVRFIQTCCQRGYELSIGIRHPFS